jgi:phytoene/squalene synthetase
VGLLVLHVAGAVSDRNVADSDAICAALQVLEHCQDVGEDAQAGRVYVPQRDLRSAGVRFEDLLGSVTSPSLRSVIGLQVERAQRSLVLGDSLVPRLSGWARLAVAGYVAGGVATATALQRARYDVLAHSVRPSRARTVAHVVRLLTR